MSDPEAPGAVDERARIALESLRQEPSTELERPLWLDRARRAVDDRWPMLVERPVTGLVVGVALVVAAVGLALWVTSSGAGSSTSGLPAAVSLPFTTPLEPSSPGDRNGAPGTTAAALVVHAAGAVASPGVHRVPNGARVADVLDAAGGVTPDADLDRVNLAAPLADGQRLYVPRLGEAAIPVPIGPSEGTGGPGVEGDGTPAAAGPVDLNRATESELDVLPGVGPATAAAIVAHRGANGPFSRVDDLLEVRGIGPAKLEALRDLVTVG